MKKFLFIYLMLVVSLLVSGCNDHSVKQIKVDYFDIGLGQTLYEGYGKVDKETVQALAKHYNQIEHIGITNQQINDETAITINFIYNDQIAGSIVIDDQGVFQLKDDSRNYEIDPSLDFYKQAINIYNSLKNQY